jgi:hypothetical protein
LKSLEAIDESGPVMVPAFTVVEELDEVLELIRRDS